MVFLHSWTGILEVVLLPGLARPRATGGLPTRTSGHYARPVQPPILDFDPDQQAVIEPRHFVDRADVPRHAVITWFDEIVDDVSRSGHKVHEVKLESLRGLIHEVEVDGLPIVIAEMPVGAPGAAIMLEHVIGIGCDTIVAVGSAGGLADSMNPGTIIVPSEAVRDEGTSYHYLPPNVPAKPDPEVAGALVDVLRARGVTFTRGRTWTTDAVFRETRAMAHKRADQGCVTVEMEAATLFAVAAFRNVRLGQLLYVADTLWSSEWDGQALVQPLRNVRRTLFGFAVEALRAL